MNVAVRVQLPSMQVMYLLRVARSAQSRPVTVYGLCLEATQGGQLTQGQAMVLLRSMGDLLVFSPLGVHLTPRAEALLSSEQLCR